MQERTQLNLQTKGAKKNSGYTDKLKHSKKIEILIKKKKLKKEIKTEKN